MGTWNATPWGNDTAMDWLAELTSHADGSAFLAASLSHGAASEGADAPDAERIVAAAAVVAAAATDPVGAVNATARQWIVTAGFAPHAGLLEGALSAMASVRTASELRDLWDESGTLTAWLKEVDEVIARLQAARSTPVVTRSPKAIGVPRSLHKLVALFASTRDPVLREKMSRKIAALRDPNTPTADTDFEPPLQLVARCGLLEETRLLLARGADPAHGSGRAFIDACAAGHLDVAQALRDAGAPLFHEHRLSPDSGIARSVAINDPEQPPQGHRYCLALFAVARAGPPEAADYLCRLGANLAQTDINGETLLHKAAESGCVPMIQYLVDHGLDPDRVKGESGESPLHYATRAARVDAVRALLQRGANPNVVHTFAGESHRWRETPLDVATSPDITDLLVAHGARVAGGEPA